MPSLARCEREGQGRSCGAGALQAISKDGVQLNVMKNGDFFGEIALLTLGHPSPLFLPWSPRT
jgi:hypothetical protein